MKKALLLTGAAILLTALIAGAYACYVYRMSAPPSLLKALAEAAR